VTSGSNHGAKVKGGAELVEKLSALQKAFPKVVVKAITAEAHVILSESVRLCPVATGRLRASGYVAPPESAENPHVRLGFGADYAVPVHEMTEVHHAEGTGAKFLSRPVDAHKGSFAADVAERIRSDEKVKDWVKEGLE
jgi:hypothetical protein